MTRSSDRRLRCAAPLNPPNDSPKIIELKSLAPRKQDGEKVVGEEVKVSDPAETTLVSQAAVKELSCQGPFLASGAVGLKPAALTDEEARADVFGRTGSLLETLAPQAALEYPAPLPALAEASTQRTLVLASCHLIEQFAEGSQLFLGLHCASLEVGKVSTEGKNWSLRIANTTEAFLGGLSRSFVTGETAPCRLQVSDLLRVQTPRQSHETQVLLACRIIQKIPEAGMTSLRHRVTKGKLRSRAEQPHASLRTTDLEVPSG